MRSPGPFCAILLFVLSGCSRFIPTERASLNPGEAVRVELTREQMGTVAAEMGAFRESLTGTVLEVDDAGMGLTLSTARNQTVQAARELRSYLYLPWEGVSAVERRAFSPVRTGLLATAGVAAAWALLELATGGGGADGEGPNTNSQRISVPVFGFVF